MPEAFCLDVKKSQLNYQGRKRHWDCARYFIMNQIRVMEQD